MSAQERREALERGGQRNTRSSEQRAQDDGEGADPGDEGDPQDGCLGEEGHRNQGRLEDRGRRRGEQREGVVVEDLQGSRIVGDGQVVAGVEGLEGDEGVAREEPEDENRARAADHEEQPAPQQGRGGGGLRVNREGTAHPPRDDAQGGIEDHRNEKERGRGHELGPSHPVLVGALGECDTRRRDRRQTEDQLEDEGAEVGGAPALAQPVGEDQLKSDGGQAQQSRDDAGAALEPPRGAQRPAHLRERSLGGRRNNGQRCRTRPAQGSDGGELTSDRDVVSGPAARPANPRQPRGHDAREECPHARIRDRRSEDRRRQEEDSDEEEMGAPTPVRGQRLRCGTHEGDEDEACAPQAPGINRLAPHGEHPGKQGKRQPRGCDADDLAGSGCRHPRACTEVPLGGAARNDHRGDAEYGCGDEIAGNRADGGEN